MSRTHARLAQALGVTVLVTCLAYCAHSVHETSPPEPSSAAVVRSSGSEAARTLARGGLGTNLTGLTDWTTEEPFVDAYKMARKMVSGSAEQWAIERDMDVDAHGWVRRLREGELGRTLVYTDTGRFRPGRYVVTYEGEGELRYNGAAQVVSQAPGRTELEVRAPRPGDTGITMDLVRVNASNPMRNVHIWAPGGACAEDHARFCDAQTPCPSGECLSFAEHGDELVFHPEFLATLAPYGMLRFMDFMSTNGSPVRRWEDRAKVDDATWTDRGVPLEIMIRLANQTHTQPWFCIPHEADDDYVRHFAEQVRDEMDPSLPVWIEYSNEIWNAIFPQHRYAAVQGETRELGEGFEGVLRFQARRSLEIFRIFEEVLGAERLVRVVASQASNLWVAQTLLEGELAGHVDALAIAPYFGLVPNAEQRSAVASTSLDALFARTREELLPEALQWTREHAELAEEHGLRLVAYEGGQHFVGVEGAEDDARINALFDAANRDPRMGELYLAYLDGWREAGGSWFNHFVNVSPWTKWGRWGALEHVRQPRSESPKFDALATFAERHPNGW